MSLRNDKSDNADKVLLVCDGKYGTDFRERVVNETAYVDTLIFSQK